ncbi:MAG: right-handed parallel beta-helix repeat-containing protein [Lachnospiraceae bacterium]|nr:right-handed parallel beta-helix repeat-containing protein [Lachnospiraceae bacterium]
MKKKNKIMVMLFSGALSLSALCGIAFAGNGASYDYDVTEAQFGANGADMLSDDAAIQKALDMAKNSESVVKIHIPSGTYYLDKPLYIVSNTELILEEDTVIKRNDQTKQMISSRVDANVGGYGQFHDITIRGGIWDGCANGNGQGALMMFYHGTNLSLHDATLRNGAGRHLFIAAGVDGVTVENSTFENQIEYTGTAGRDKYMIPEKNSTEVRTYSNYRNMEMLHLDCINEDGRTEFEAYPLDNTTNKNVLIKDCTFKNGFSALGGHCEYNPIAAENYVLTGNTFINIQYTCIDVYGAKNVEVSENRGENVGEIVRANNVDGLKLTDNAATIVLNDNFNLNGVCLKDCKATTIEKLSFDKSTDQGIELWGTTIESLKDVTIENAGQNGIHAFGGSQILKTEGLTVKGSELSGVYAKDCGIINISGAVLENNKDSGVAAENCEDVVFENNTIDNAGVNAILITSKNAASSRGLIRGNNIRKCVRGINTYGATIRELSSNMIQDATGNGINIVTGAVVDSVSDNKVDGAEGTGMFVSGAKIRMISKNIVTGSGADGIDIKDESEVTEVSDNDVDGSGKFGVLIANSKTLLKSNKIINAKQHGVLLNNKADAVISENEIISAGGSGIYADGAVAKIRSNTVSGAANWGIGVNNSAGSDSNRTEIESNEVSDSGSIGINVTASSSVSVGSNNVAGSSAQGIRIYASDDAEVSGNKIDSSEKQGILIEKSARSNVSSNNVTGSKETGIYTSECTGLTLDDNSSFDNTKNDIALNNNSSGTVSNNHTSDGKVALWNGSDKGTVLSGTDISIGTCEVSSIAHQKYTGSPITPSVTVKKNGASLVQGRDYNLTYLNNTKYGIGTARVNGIGTYGGHVDIDFEIDLYKDGVGFFIVNGKLLKVYNMPEHLVIPDEVLYIGEGLFKNNTKLKNVYMKTTLKGVCEDAFSGCKSLKHAYFTGEEGDLAVASGNDPFVKVLWYGYYDRFTDVPHGSWYEEYVQQILKYGAMNGLNETEFGPLVELNRAMAATLLWKREGKPDIEIPKSIFDDVKNRRSWYYVSVAWANSVGIVTGYQSKGVPTGYFGPEDYITREQFAVIAYRYAKYKGGNMEVANKTAYQAAKDYKEVDSWAVDAVNWAYVNGIMGVGSDLKPHDSVTRAETATIIARVIRFLEK